MASGTAAPALGTSPVLFPSWGNRTLRFNLGRILDSENLYVDHAAHASRSAIHLGHGDDGRHGCKGRRRPSWRGGRSAWAQEFGRAVYRRLEERNFRRPPHPTI